MAAQDFELKLDPQDESRLLADVRRFDRELSKALGKNIRAVAQPVGKQMVRDVLPEIPRRGGLAARIARTRPGVSIHTGIGSAGVQLVFRKPRVLGYINQGQIPHPVFARAGEARSGWEWRTQSIRPGLLTEAFDRDAPEAKPAIQRAVLEALDTIRAGVVTR